LVYEDLNLGLCQLFGWDLESLLLTTHQKRCQAFLSAGNSDEALEAHKCMMNVIDETAKASCLNWPNGKFLLTSPAAIILTYMSPRIQGALTAQDDRILGVCIYFLNYFATDLYTGGDPRTRTRRL
jgi:hypothetical protein